MSSTEIVLFDTDYYRGKPNLINVCYPESDWIRAISETTFLELMDRDGKSDKDIRMREAALKRYSEYNMHTLVDYNSTVALEVEHKLRDIEFPTAFPLSLNSVEEGIRRAADGYAIDPIIESKLSSHIKALTSDESSVWDRIPITEEEICEIDLQELHKKEDEFIEKLLAGDLSFKGSEPGAEEFEKYLPILIEKFGRHVLEKNCPSYYSIIRIQCFIDSLRKPRNSKHSFTIRLGDSDQTMKMKKSFFSDIVLADEFPGVSSRFLML